MKTDLKKLDEYKVSKGNYEHLDSARNILSLLWAYTNQY